jgi:hypothetical protein
MSAPVDSRLWGGTDDHLDLVARNVTTRYATTMHPRLNAWTNAASAVGNIALSVALIQRFGLPGAALVPVACAAAFVLFRAACRRVGLPVKDAVRQALWPAAWPGIIAGVFLCATRPLVPAGLLPALCQLSVSCLIYEVLFFAFAISREDRAFYRTNVLRLVGRYRNLPAAV